MRFHRGGIAAFVCTLACATFLTPCAALAQDAASRPGPTGVATALPPLTVPAAKPCVVELFANVAFTDAKPRAFDYAPPHGCRGAWARVVLQTDWSVTPGRQFDRTASVWIGNLNVFFGSTQEPSRTIGPHWSVRRNVTELSHWLRHPHAGHTLLVNVVNKKYTGVIRGSARLLFYPGKAPDVPDRVVSLATRPGGGLDTVEPGAPRTGRTLVLPRNMQAIFLDVVAQSQAGDEFWEFCVPDSVARKLQACGGSGFRQTTVYIDHQPAGVAPVYPWIYTGGVGPALWRPIPGVQTLDFRPFRVNLTPFAALLDDGKPHRISLGVANAQRHFALAAQLLIWQDRGRAVVTGALTRNTLGADPAQRDQVTRVPDEVTRVGTTSRRDFHIEGYVDTSHGRVTTAIHQDVDFDSDQAFTSGRHQDSQLTRQLTRTHVDTRISANGVRRQVRRSYGYVLLFNYRHRGGSPADQRDSLRATQSYVRYRSLERDGHTLYSDQWSNHVTPRATYLGKITGGAARVNPWTSAQHVNASNSLGQCFARAIISRRHELLSVTDGQTCDGSNRWRWLADPRQRVDPSSPRGSEAALWGD